MAPSTSPPNLLSTFLTTVIEKIVYAFYDLNIDDLDGIIQFWAPVQTNGGMWLLTTSDQPFVLTENNKDVKKYRSCCAKYHYNVDLNIDLHHHHVKLEIPWNIISNGAPAATAFLNQMPELVSDLRVQLHLQMNNPLVSCAIKSGLFHSLVVPVFWPSESCCVGVVECCSSSYGNLVHMFNELNDAFEDEGLKMFQPQERLPFKIISSLKYAKNEIDYALEIICQTFRLDLVQVLIAYKNEEHITFSSSLEEQKRRTKQMFGLKLTDRYGFASPYDNEFEHVESYGKICYMLPLKKGEGLIGKALQNYEPHLFKKVPKSSDYNEPHMLLSCFDSECSCFVICLKNTKTSDLDYIFEFLWHEGPNYVIFLESLLMLLKRCLPHFKYAYGAELGDELRIKDANNSKESELFGSFKIFQGRNKSSSASEALEKRLRPLEAKCKTTPIFPLYPPNMIFKDAKNLKGLHKNESGTNEEEAIVDPSINLRETCLDENMVTIKAEYAGDVIEFTFPISSATFVAIQKEIGKRLKLNTGNYKLKYLDEDDEWILLTSDEDMKACIKNRRDLTSIVRLCLLQGQQSDPSLTYLNESILAAKK